MTRVLRSRHPVFLTVGTLEPRKGHAQALAAFEQLWSEGSEAELVIVGSRAGRWKSWSSGCAIIPRPASVCTGLRRRRMPISTHFTAGARTAGSFP